MKEAIPSQWLALQNLLAYTNAHKVARRSHLVTKLFPRIILFLLVSLCRVRNNQHFSCLGAITSASSYGVGDTDNVRRSLKFFGTSISRTSLSTKMNKLSHLPTFYKNLRNSLSTQWFQWNDTNCISHKKWVYFLIYDNSQKNSPYKFQRIGSTSRFC